MEGELINLYSLLGILLSSYGVFIALMFYIYWKDMK